MIPHNRYRPWLIALLALLAIVPIVMTAYEVMFTENTSVTFLGHLHPNVAFLVIGYYVVLMGIAVGWFVRQMVHIRQLMNERTKAELMLLKSQVSPHFFFNMLNSIYGWVGKDAKTAQDLILKLSDLMRYSIYEGEKETVTLKEEIDFLRNVIELHRMRYHQPIDVDIVCDVDENRRVVPLLYIILLENAFKHGIEKNRENAFIRIQFKTTSDRILFSIENNKEPALTEAGIGLINLKRRLELTYPNRHELIISGTDASYKVQLNLTHI